ncbi:MAG: hypothetical protein KatS3mg115_0876 [Candidatus Poribacteria bacterium]|nr:MAG: hypothetical protein KatS3mg115_0876 [Candidatus Poribacteria bacterium]
MLRNRWLMSLGVALLSALTIGYALSQAQTNDVEEEETPAQPSSMAPGMMGGMPMMQGMMGGPGGMMGGMPMMQGMMGGPGGMMGGMPMMQGMMGGPGGMMGGMPMMQGMMGNMPMMSGAGGRFPSPGALLAQADRLNLSEEQRAALRELDVQFRESQIDRHATAQRLMLRIHTGLSQEEPNLEQVEGWIRDLADVHASAWIERLRTAQAAWNLLNDDQRELVRQSPPAGDMPMMQGMMGGPGGMMGNMPMMQGMMGGQGGMCPMCGMMMGRQGGMMGGMPMMQGMTGGPSGTMGSGSAPMPAQPPAEGSAGMSGSPHEEHHR